MNIPKPTGRELTLLAGGVLAGIVVPQVLKRLGVKLI